MLGQLFIASHSSYAQSVILHTPDYSPYSQTSLYCGPPSPTSRVQYCLVPVCALRVISGLDSALSALALGMSFPRWRLYRARFSIEPLCYLPRLRILLTGTYICHLSYTLPHSFDRGISTNSPDTSVKSLRWRCGLPQQVAHEVCRGRRRSRTQICGIDKSMN